MTELMLSTPDSLPADESTGHTNFGCFPESEQFSSQLAYQPAIDSRIKALLKQRQKLAEWVHCFGSPLNLLFPQIALENGKRWRGALSSTYPDTDIRFGMKACKSDALTTAYAIAGLGMDVSSWQELMSAMQSLVPCKRISFTGPDKPIRDLTTCIAHEIPINIDSECELNRVVSLRAVVGTQARVVLRLLPANQPDSRFGLKAQDLLAAANQLAVSGIPLEGLSFHLSGYDSHERVEAATEALSLMRKLLSRGIISNSLSIGGGFSLSYLPKAASVGDADEIPTWQGRSRPSNYPYHTEVSGERHAAHIVKEILSRDSNQSIVDELKLKLILEPGRALTDQCGGTLFRVIGTKQAQNGVNLVVLDGMSFSLAENWFGSDFLPLPLHIPQTAEPEQGPAACVLVGRSCLECDVVRWRVVHFKSVPQPGDLIYLHNTAGYQMDMNESSFHRIELPQKLAVFFYDTQTICQLDTAVNAESFIAS